MATLSRFYRGFGVLKPPNQNAYPIHILSMRYSTHDPQSQMVNRIRITHPGHSRPPVSSRASLGFQFQPSAFTEALIENVVLRTQ